MIDTATAEVLVAGTSGGAGTTTVTALLFAAMSQDPAGAPRLRDHSAGELGLRLPDGDEVRSVNSALAIHDLGAHAVAAVRQLADPRTVVVLVAPATPYGCAAVARVVEPVNGRELRRVLIAAVGVFGQHRIGPRLQELGGKVGTRSVILLPQDLALAAGGRIPTVRLATHTVRAQRQLESVLRERLRSL
jgi:hypothetical protein